MSSFLTTFSDFAENSRRERDSNPWNAKAFNGFRDRPIRPLWHLSPTFYKRKATLVSCSQRRQRDSNPRYISV